MRYEWRGAVIGVMCGLVFGGGPVLRAAESYVLRRVKADAEVEIHLNDVNSAGNACGYLKGGRFGKQAIFVSNEEIVLISPWQEKKRAVGKYDAEVERPMSEALALNDKNQVVGWATTSDWERHAFIWERGDGKRDLGTLGGDMSKPHDVNDHGCVVGKSKITDEKFGYVHAFAWYQGTMRDLGSLARDNPELEAAESAAYAVNNDFLIGGMSAMKGRLNKGRAVLFRHGAVTKVTGPLAERRNGKVVMAEPNAVVDIAEDGRIVAMDDNIMRQTNGVIWSAGRSV